MVEEKRLSLVAVDRVTIRVACFHECQLLSEEVLAPFCSVCMSKVLQVIACQKNHWSSMKSFVSDLRDEGAVPGPTGEGGLSHLFPTNAFDCFHVCLTFNRDCIIRTNLFQLRMRSWQSQNIIHVVERAFV